jgi:TRAP-type C4-dicarboxylate transport system permease small subunit
VTPSEPGAPPPPAGAPLLAWLDWRLGRLEDALNLVAAVAIFGVMAFGVVQILSRTVSGLVHDLWPAIPPIAIYGYIDYVQFVAILYAILGIAYCQRLGGHIRMEIVLTTLRGRLLWALETAATVLAITVTVMLIAGTWDNFHNAWARGDSSMDIRLPQWPSKLVVPFVLAVLLARLLLQLWGYARLLADPARKALAVPLPETVREAARREIEEAIGKAEADERAGAGRA